MTSRTLEYKQGWTNNNIFSSIEIEPIDDDYEFFNIKKYNYAQDVCVPQKEFEIVLSANDSEIIRHLYGELMIQPILEEK